MQALAKAQTQTAKVRQELDNLNDIADEYKTKHAAAPQMNPAVLKQFRQFYGQLSQARAVQSAQVEQALAAEQTVRRYLSAHIKDRKGLETVLAKRDQVHREQSRRKSRRSQISKSKSLV